MTADWNEIIESAGANTVQEFASGKVTVHDFRRTSPAAQRLMKLYNAETARRLARKALSRRHVETARRLARKKPRVA